MDKAINFERGIDPKESMKIGREGWLRALIKSLVREAGKNPDINRSNMDVFIKWKLESEGIELIKIVEQTDWPQDYKYDFFYKDKGEGRDPLMRKLRFTVRELYY